MSKSGNGYPTHGGGMSPLWDGRWTTLDFAKYGTGIHTDIIKYENNLVKVYGNPYAVRIIYGPLTLTMRHPSWIFLFFGGRIVTFAPV